MPLFQLMQWVAAQEITQIPEPFQQATGTHKRESTVQLKKKGSEAGSQVIRLSGSHPHKNKQKKQQLEMLRIESFMASTAEPRTVQLSGGGASTITEALHP